MLSLACKFMGTIAGWQKSAHSPIVILSGAKDLLFDQSENNSRSFARKERGLRMTIICCLR